ncbi:MAG: hypothetical protein LBD11_04715 [Candidatus Peribacteria bacterium]|jgi:hypothetical protein|nr:hypothetical protein [Candidatus Peribacteria bacterium]
MLELLQTNASRIISKEQEYLADNLLAFQTYQKETEGFDVVHDLNGDENSRTRSDENPKFEKFLQAKDTLLAMLEKNSEELKKSLLSSK